MSVHLFSGPVLVSTLVDSREPHVVERNSWPRKSSVAPSNANANETELTPPSLEEADAILARFGYVAQAEVAVA